MQEDYAVQGSMQGSLLLKSTTETWFLSATIAAATIKIPENFQVNVDELNKRLASASISVSQVQDVYNNIEKSLDGQPEAHRDVVSASDKLVVQLEEMNSLVKQLNEKYSAIAKAMGN